MLSRLALERIRLEVDDERALAEVEHVDEAVQHDAVVLEGEGLLPPGTFERGQPCGELRVAVRGEEAFDPRELLLRSGRLQRSQVAGDRGSREVDALEQLVHGRADAERAEHGLAAPLAHAGHIARVELRGALLERRERAVREPARLEDGRGLERLEGRQFDAPPPQAPPPAP